MADLAITATQVLAGIDAQFYQGITDVAVTAGTVVTLSPSNNRFQLADSNASLDAAEVRGIALHQADQGQPLRVQTGGSIFIGAAAAPVVSTIYIDSATPGKICPAADLVSGMYTTIIGIGGALNTLKMSIFPSRQLKP